MLVDTDVLIWNLRGSKQARGRLDSVSGLLVSVATYYGFIDGVDIEVFRP